MMTYEFFAALFFIAFNAFFVIGEFALVKMRTSRIQELVDAGNRRAKIVARMQESIDQYLSTIQMGVTLSSVGLGWMGESRLAAIIEAKIPSTVYGVHVLAHSVAIVTAFLFITYFQIVLGELVPRALAIRFAEPIILFLAPILNVIRTFSAPFLFIFDVSARAILRFLGIKTSHNPKEKFTEDELRLVLIDSLGKGSMADTKLDLIDNVFDFSKRNAKHVMIARDNIVGLDLGRPIDENMAKAKQSNHTRYPLYEASVDQVIGLVNFKDVLWQSEESRENMDLRRIRRDILFVPENKPLTKLLKDFQRNKIHMAIVIDEFGVTVGLVTLEDVLEELVGEIQDEYDQEVTRIQLLRDGSYLIEGATLIDEVEEKLGLQIEKADNTTIGGAVLSKLGRLPKVGDMADFQDFTFIVKSLKGRRISSVHAIKRARPTAPSSSGPT